MLRAIALACAWLYESRLANFHQVLSTQIASIKTPQEKPFCG
jgi:hypothetical protein